MRDLIKDDQISRMGGILAKLTWRFFFFFFKLVSAGQEQGPKINPIKKEELVQR